MWKNILITFPACGRVEMTTDQMKKGGTFVYAEIKNSFCLYYVERKLSLAETPSIQRVFE